MLHNGDNSVSALCFTLILLGDVQPRDFTVNAGESIQPALVGSGDAMDPAGRHLGCSTRMKVTVDGCFRGEDDSVLCSLTSKPMPLKVA